MEDRISKDNLVSFIDAFVWRIDLALLGFDSQIYLYDYLNAVRSSGKLEKECFRNIEMQWLLSGLVPNYHSISDFRKEISPKDFQQLKSLKVSDKIIVRSRSAGYSLNHPYLIISGDHIE